MLAELRVDAELVGEALEGHDALKGELDADPVRVLVADAAARQRRRARADRLPLEDEHPAEPLPREVIRGAGAHDAGADDDNVRGLGHRCLHA